MVTFIYIELDYVCNQPSVNSRGVDSFGDAIHGIMSWNDVVMYPDAYDEQEILVNARIQMPDDWSLASAMPGQEVNGWMEFERCDLRTCIDSPLIAGKYLQSYILNDGGKDVRLHCVGESQASIVADAEFLQSMRNMVVESRLLFGKEHLFSAAEICKMETQYMLNVFRLLFFVVPNVHKS